MSWLSYTHGPAPRKQPNQVHMRARASVDGRVGSYWARLDANQEIIDNDLGDGQLIVIVHKGDFALKVSGTLQPA
ncbi:MAG: hypothetical protein ACXVLX_13390 [Ilumatobacteraceae bacterium]